MLIKGANLNKGDQVFQDRLFLLLDFLSYAILILE